MDKPQSLAEYLGLVPEAPDEGPRLVDITDPKEFGKAVMESYEFRQYIVSGLTLGNLPGFTSILGRLMDHVMGKAPDRVEHTGKDGQPIETVVTEVRRVIVRPEDDEDDRPVITH
jgi:hypothetical protein